jgi:membrane protease YdiL (CAAX protease family)
MSKIILEILTVLVMAVLPQVLNSFYPQEWKDLLAKFPANWRSASAFFSRIGMILLALYIFANHPGGYHIVGLTNQEIQSFPVLLTAGALTIYLSLIFVFSKLRSQKTKQEIEVRQQNTLAALRYSPNAGFWGTLLSFVDIWLAVLGEELIYRGYFVLLLGAVTGTFVPWVVLSITLSVLVHLYQGFTWKVALGHAILAAIFIAAALITKSLFAAIVPHLVYDTIWLARALRSTPKETASL